MTKHFFKTVIIFTGIIFLGLLGMFLISYFDKQNDIDNTTSRNMG